MRALVSYAERPAQIDQLPVPSAEGQLLVRVELVGICRTDISAARGDFCVRAGRVLGHEGVGTVVRASERAPETARDARVALIPWVHCGRCPPCTSGCPERCESAEFLGIDRDGAFGEYVVVPARATVAIPQGVSWSAAALLEPVSAARAVLAPLTRLTGRVGLIAEGRFQTLLELVLAHPSADIKVEPWREGTSYDVVLDAQGTSLSIARSVGSVRSGGTVLVKSRPNSPVELPLRQAVQKELCLRGTNYASFPDSMTWIAENKTALLPLIGKVFPLGQFETAFAELDEGKKSYLSLGAEPCAV